MCVNKTRLPTRSSHGNIRRAGSEIRVGSFNQAFSRIGRIGHFHKAGMESLFSCSTGLVARTKCRMLYCRIAARAVPQTCADRTGYGGQSGETERRTPDGSVHKRGTTVVGSAAV